MAPHPGGLPFQHQGRDLEARTFFNGEKWIVRIFEGNRPVTKRTYDITDDDADDATIQELLTIARDDVLSGICPLLS